MNTTTTKTTVTTTTETEDKVFYTMDCINTDMVFNAWCEFVNLYNMEAKKETTKLFTNEFARFNSVVCGVSSNCQWCQVTEFTDWNISVLIDGMKKFKQFKKCELFEMLSNKFVKENEIMKQTEEKTEETTEEKTVEKTDRQKHSIKTLAKAMNLDNTTDKLINKYRKVTSLELSDKEFEIHRVIIDLLTSHNDNKGYQFTVSTVRKAFYNNGIVTRKQQEKNLEKLLNGKTVKHSKENLSATDWINDDIIAKVIGKISVNDSNEFNLSIIPNSNGDYQFRRISNDKEFFYMETKKKQTEKTDIQKMLTVAQREEFGISVDSDNNDLYSLIKSLVSTYNDSNEKKISIAIM